MPTLPVELAGLAVAAGIGLLVGIERERSKGTGAARAAAGVRTFLLLALAGAVAQLLGPLAVAVAGGFAALAALSSYRYSRARDPGLTTESAMLLVYLLGVLAMQRTVLAAGLGVAVAVVLASKSRLHRFARQVLTTQELHDVLLLAAAAAIVLPLLPDRSIDPWQALNPRKLWLLVVLVMGIQAMGYVALRALGPRAGLALAGLAGGFVSSTATIAAMGERSREEPALAPVQRGLDQVLELLPIAHDQLPLHLEHRHTALILGLGETHRHSVRSWSRSVTPPWPPPRQYHRG